MYGLLRVLRNLGVPWERLLHYPADICYRQEPVLLANVDVPATCARVVVSKCANRRGGARCTRNESLSSRTPLVPARVLVLVPHAVRPPAVPPGVSVSPTVQTAESETHKATQARFFVQDQSLLRFAEGARAGGRRQVHERRTATATSHEVQLARRAALGSSRLHNRGV